jgi:NTE family protein
MPTAFVLSGGGSLGAVQVGMLRALVERGVRPDLVVGSSVGAINGAWLASRADAAGVAELAEIWRSIGRRDVFPVRPVAGMLGFLGRRNHLVPSPQLERLIRLHLPFGLIEEARVPLHVVATEVTTGREVLLSRGDAAHALLASAAIPGVYPPVHVDGHQLMDAAVVNNTPVSHAVHLGATVVYVLPTGYACALPRAPQSALGMVLQALTLLIERQLMDDIERYESAVELHVIPPLCPLSVSPVDFGRSEYLIDQAYAASVRWLDDRPRLSGQRSLLGFHVHTRPAGDSCVDQEGGSSGERGIDDERGGRRGSEARRTRRR